MILTHRHGHYDSYHIVYASEYYFLQIVNNYMKYDTNREIMEKNTSSNVVSIKLPYFIVK